jgi:hypothetical protein
MRARRGPHPGRPTPGAGWRMASRCAWSSTVAVSFTGANRSDRSQDARSEGEHRQNRCRSPRAGGLERPQPTRSRGSGDVAPPIPNRGSFEGRVREPEPSQAHDGRFSGARRPPTGPVATLRPGRLARWVHIGEDRYAPHAPHPLAAGLRPAASAWTRLVSPTPAGAARALDKVVLLY